MHPGYDCEDCGVHHLPWSVHERDRLDRLDKSGEVSVLLDALLQAARGYDLAVLRYAVDALHDITFEAETGL